MRKIEEKIVMELNIAASKLLEIYQWDHQNIAKQQIDELVLLIKEKLADYIEEQKH